MYSATLERSTPIDRIMRTTAKAMSDAHMKAAAAARRANKATNMAMASPEARIRDKLIQQGALK